jgi:hypothetical protein
VSALNPLPAAAVVAVVFLAGCGGSGGSGKTTTAASRPATTSTGAATTRSASTTTTGAPGALQAEATSAAAGDIPDNQVFLVFRNAKGGYSMKYPEGWAQRGSGKQVTFRDKNNIVRVVVGSGGAPPAAAVAAGLRSAKLQGAPQRLTISGRPALKVTYRTESAPNPVTGKGVTLTVDRYELWQGGRRAVVDLGTPVGVDNIDAYRLMIESFRWR